LEYGTKKLIAENIKDNKADRARRIFRSANTLSVLLMVAVTIKVLISGSLNHFLVFISDNFINLAEEEDSK
jgi:hypothetical protein